MKKILSLGAAAAVLSLTAVAASAAVTPQFDPANPVEGEQVTVTIVADGPMTQGATQFTVNASDNLEYVSSSTPTDGSLGMFDAATGKYVWATGSETLPGDGYVLLTLTYNVNAAANDEVSVALVPDAGFEADVNANAVNVVVNASAPVESDVPTPPETVTEPPVETVTEPPVETVTEPPIETDGGVVTPPDTQDTETPPAPTTPTTPTDNKGNPSTGVPLAIIPVVLAGAAVVAAKKRK